MSQRRKEVDEVLLDQISNDFNFRGGYNSYNVHDKIAGGDGDTLLIREQASTFTNYVTGTIQLVFMIFFVFILISVMTFSLMGYARYLNRRKPKSGFYNPPPMLRRYNRQRATNPEIYSSVDRPNTGSPAWQVPSQSATLSQHTQPASLAMSQQTIDSHRTATSTML